MEKTNPVFNTAKTTLFQMAQNDNPYAAAIMEKIVLETRYQTMGKLARKSGFPVIIDLPCGNTPREIETISSAGLRVLLIMQKQHGVKLSGVNSAVKEILETTGFDSILDVE